MVLKGILVLTLLSSQLYLCGYGQVTAKSFVTCEFDLIDELLSYDPDIFKKLPAECEQAYKDEDLRQLMADESLKFKDFMTELGKKEKWKEQGEEEDREFLNLEHDLRNAIYESSDGNCTMTSETNADFINCKIEKREEMINVILGSE